MTDSTPAAPGAKTGAKTSAKTGASRKVAARKSIARKGTARNSAGKGADMPSPLTPAQLKILKRRAHALRPVVMLGREGLTDAVARELDIALDHHELVKVRLAGADAPARAAQLEALAGGAGAAVVQRIGHTATLYRRNRRRPVIDLQPR